MKIQLNSLHALERLIGNDNELEMEIRGSIVQEFTKRHLKALMTEKTVKEIEKQMQADYSRIVTSKYNTVEIQDKTLREQLREVIQKTANKIAEDEVRAVSKDVEAVIKNKIDFIVDKYVTDIMKKVDARVNQLILDKVNLIFNTKLNQDK